MLRLKINKGSPGAQGPIVTGAGFNFCVRSSLDVGQICLRLFENADAAEPSSVIPMSGSKIKLGHNEYKAWHLHISADGNLYYQYEVDGVICADPAGREFTGNLVCDDTGTITLPKAIAKRDTFDWGNDRRPNIPMARTEVYELNARGFTQQGFLGIAEKVEYLSQLCTSVELMPAMQGDPNDLKTKNPFTGKKNIDSWCYNTWGYFAPCGFLASAWGRQVREFKTMVKTLHEKDREVILDIVFNHTREFGADGPVIHFKALGPSHYYFREPDGTYPDALTGCGNTFNVYDPLAVEFILECLRYWYNEMHVDGFRFDLFAVLMKNPDLVQRILTDPELRGCKIFPEPWALGLYLVGACGNGTAEWNGRFRDDVRDWMRGEFGKASIFRTRVSGSQDMFHPWNDHWSVNFITCHDGFTLEDLVSWNFKDNLANGEENRDGENHNRSWNCGPSDEYNGALDPNAPGAEGERVRKLPADERKRVLRLRAKQKRNFLVTVYLSQGIPLLLFGDEIGRTQGGSNNSYCQPELNRMPWELLTDDNLLYAFVVQLVKLRRSLDINNCDIVWHGVQPRVPDFSDGARFYAEELVPRSKANGEHAYWAANAHDGEITVTLPEPPAGQRWYQVINTEFATTDLKLVEGSEYKVPPRSNCVLVSR